ncbi:MAG: hypothetical protein MZV63_35125 [Marinilabiliales bacterium]|nr:hypothetical protein [Marinilabiliales bacterium]
MTGFRPENLRHNGEAVLNGYDETGTILFVNSTVSERDRIKKRLSPMQMTALYL